MMTLIPAILVASNLIQASATSCAPIHPEIRVSQDVRPPRIDDSKTSEQLKSMTLKDALTTDPKFAETVGLTAATISVDSEIRTKSSGPETGPICVAPSVITIKLSTAPNVYIDASRGACRQSVAIGHEMGHVAIDRKLIERFTAIFRSRIATMTDAIGAVPAPSYDDTAAVRERIEDKINAMLSVTYDSMASERSLEHKAHDSPEEYRRVSMACPTVSVNPSTAAPHLRSRTGDS